ncbi:hypothetical protein BDD12DRAFT_802013 [Trichophaea hybrida]|nr:hypothetical protein BDD12DRAFT_802013 [Trichophaea hybrida]
MENVVGVRSEPPLTAVVWEYLVLTAIFCNWINPISVFADVFSRGHSYCNSILQCLYYSKPFREHVVNFPVRGQPPYQVTPPAEASEDGTPGRPLVRINTEPLPTISAASIAAAAKAKAALASPKDEKKKPLPATAMMVQPPANPENKDSSDYKKKKALETGPVLDLDQGNHAAYEMEESLFTALKDIFESIMAHSSKTGVVKPNKFLEILRRENDMFNGQQHQDAHEFLNYVLNQVIENVETYQKKILKENGNAIPPKVSGSSTPIETSSMASSSAATASSGMAGWIHDIFEGLLSSETKCLTCENVSCRNEQFMDLSIDLEKNSSVTSCLRNFSASEMLCERNKFHCDHCGGLQEAEKRMKIKRLPRVLALHLKRFKYMESTNRFEKLHYRVLYPYHLRLFNTTDDAEEPDRLYELYAVVVHIGGGPYHGHYVAIVKTEDKGWLLFDDELVEPVDKSYVRNFFGERTGTGVASAYVLFYQETTFEAVQREIWADEQTAAAAATSTAEAAMVDPLQSKALNGVNGHAVKPQDLVKEDLVAIQMSITSPLPKSEFAHDDHRAPGNSTAEHLVPPIKSKKERGREKKEEKEREKAERKAAAKSSDEKEKDGAEGRTSMSRFKNTSRSLRQPPKWLGGGGGGGGHHKVKEKVLSPVPIYGTIGYDNDEHTAPPLPPRLNGSETTDRTPTPAPVLANGQKENSPPTAKKEKEDKKRNQERKEKLDSDTRKKLHHHRPSLFGLRKKAQPTLGE